jgi:hypothetical protein
MGWDCSVTRLRPSGRAPPGRVYVACFPLPSHWALRAPRARRNARHHSRYDGPVPSRLMTAVLGLVVVSTDACRSPSRWAPDPVAKSAGNDGGATPASSLGARASEAITNQGTARRPTSSADPTSCARRRESSPLPPRRRAASTTYSSMPSGARDLWPRTTRTRNSERATPASGGGGTANVTAPRPSSRRTDRKG